MTGSYPPHWSLGLVCTLALASLVSSPSSATEASAPPPPPTPLILSEPLQTDVLYASGYGTPWGFAHGAWLSADGKSVAFLVPQSPAGEGTARTLVVKDVDTDAIIYEKVLYSEEEQLQMRGTDLERLARARAWEARTWLRQRQWKPLLYQELPSTDFSSDGCFEQQLRPRRSVTAGELKITYQEPRVQLSRRGKQVVDRRFPSWKVRKEWCERPNPSWLKGVFISQEHGVVLLELGFCGVDGCIEPPPAFHVLRLPSDKRRTGGAQPAQVSTPPRVPAVGYESKGSASRTLYALGLPAVSEDGALVAVGEVSADGECRDPNLLLTVRRADTNEIIWKLPVLEPGEVSSAQGSPLRLRELEGKVLERIRQANAYLGRTRWVALAEQPLEPMVAERCEQVPAQELKLTGLTLTFNQGRMVLQAQGGAPPVELQLTRGSKMAQVDCGKASKIFIEAIYVEQARGVLLLRLATCSSSKSCLAVDSWYHPLKLR
jgi:hypothetical protein